MFNFAIIVFIFDCRFIEFQSSQRLGWFRWRFHSKYASEHGAVSIENKYLAGKRVVRSKY